MKLLTSTESWTQWIRQEEGRFSDAQHPPPSRYPCYGYLELVNWGQESRTPIYLYLADIEAMALDLILVSQRM